MTKVNFPIHRSATRPAHANGAGCWPRSAAVGCGESVGRDQRRRANRFGLGDRRSLAVGDGVEAKRSSSADHLAPRAGANPAATAAKAVADIGGPNDSRDGHTGLRFAVRPDGVDGWRPAGQPASPLGGNAVPSRCSGSRTRRTSGHRSPPRQKTKTKRSATAVANVPPRRREEDSSPAAAPSFADAYGNLPAQRARTRRTKKRAREIRGRTDARRARREHSRRINRYRRAIRNRGRKLSRPVRANSRRNSNERSVGRQSSSDSTAKRRWSIRPRSFRRPR